MEPSVFPQLPASILEAALEHVKNKYHADLNRDFLNEMYWRIRYRRQALISAKKKDKTLQVSTGFYVVRDWVLDKYFPQKGPEDQFKRKAYSSGIGKIGSQLRQHKDPKFQLQRTELERIKDLVTLDADRRQYRFIV